MKGGPGQLKEAHSGQYRHQSERVRCSSMPSMTCWYLDSLAIYALRVILFFCIFSLQLSKLLSLQRFAESQGGNFWLHMVEQIPAFISAPSETQPETPEPISPNVSDFTMSVKGFSL